MEIKPKPSQLATTTSSSTINTTPLEVKPVKPVNSTLTFKANKHQTASNMLPPAIAGKMTAISRQYGLPVDLGNFVLQDATPSNVAGVRKIVDLISSNSKLLPEMLKLAKKLLKADIKLAEFHSNLTKEAIKHQEKIDRATADIFLAMVNYGSRSGKLEHRVVSRQKLIEARDAAYLEYYNNSVLGNELRVLDTEYKLLASNRQILADGRIAKKTSDAARSKRLQEYLNQAHNS